ncbi:hypothetical protein [Paenibacillus sp. sgz302251]|uniref:hypothetical protein n=1 Tax=Paenibacillus sp. sgz302251 TaxID=3414493 RepID=UPI003C7CB43F
MFMITFRNSIDPLDVRFRDVLIETLAVRRSGVLISEYDNCIFNLEDVLGYEDENGNMIEVGSG